MSDSPIRPSLQALLDRVRSVADAYQAAEGHRRMLSEAEITQRAELRALDREAEAVDGA